MRVFAIYNPLVRERRAAAWILYEPDFDFYTIELASWATPEDLPLTLALFAERGRRALDDEWARRWVKTRIPPEKRDNIGDILASHRCRDHHIPTLLANTHGRSSADDFLVEEIPEASYHTHNLNNALNAPVDLGTQISRARRAAGLTQAQLAEASGVQQAVISRIEAGHANPTVETLEILATSCGRALRITLE